MIEQQNKCQYFESKFSVPKDSCVLISKNIAYKFFDNGGDSYFEWELAQKIKSCRNTVQSDDNKQHALICQKAREKVCDILLGNNNKECEGSEATFIDLTANSLKFEEKKEPSISNSFMEVNNNLPEVRSQIALINDRFILNFWSLL